MSIPSRPLNCVIVAVDESEESMRALNWALDNLQLRPAGGSIVIFHVQSPPSIAVGINPGSIPFGGPSMEVPAFTAAIEAHQGRITDSIFSHALEICADRSVTVKTQVAIGDPKIKICEAVDHLNADLLVMGSRDVGRVKRFFVGSVSKYCRKHASCPVVILKGESGEVILAGDTL